MAYGTITGRYGLALTTGTMAAGAVNPEIFHFRWTSLTISARVLSVVVSASNEATAFAAGSMSTRLFFSTPWTVAGTGGATATLTGINGKHSAQDAVTALTEARIATTAALTSGTRTTAAHPLSTVISGIPAVAGTTMLAPTELIHFPVILPAGSTTGLSVHTTIPITGTWTAAVSIKWEEFA